MKHRLIRATVRARSRMPKRALRRIAGPALEIDGRTLDLQLQVLSKTAIKVGPKAQLSELSPDVVRDGLRQLVSVAGPEPIESVSVHDRVIPGPGGDLPVRFYHPASTTGRAPGIVWYHQGGGVIGGLDTDHGLLSLLSDRCGAVIMSVDYRLAPEHKFPAGLDDAQAAHQWMLDHADALGIDPIRIAVGGTSQGGTFAAVLCQERRARGLPQPAAQILIYPGADFTAKGGSRDSCADTWPVSADTIRFFYTHYLPSPTATQDSRVSPALADELWGLAPAVVITAGFDPVRDEGNDYAAALEAAGVSVSARCEDALCHSFSSFAGVSKEASRANQRLVDDVADVLGID